MEVIPGDNDNIFGLQKLREPSYFFQRISKFSFPWLEFPKKYLFVSLNFRDLSLINSAFSLGEAHFQIPASGEITSSRRSKRSQQTAETRVSKETKIGITWETTEKCRFLQVIFDVYVRKCWFELVYWFLEFLEKYLPQSWPWDHFSTRHSRIPSIPLSRSRELAAFSTLRALFLKNELMGFKRVQDNFHQLFSEFEVFGTGI